MNLNKVKEIKEKAQQSCTTIDTMRDFVVNACNEIIGRQKMIGKTVYVTVSGSYFYKAKILGYGAYGDDPDYNVYCVLVWASENKPIVDYFKEVHTEQEYLEWKNKQKQRQYPFGYCRKCGKEFNSELIGEYKIKHCPWCGEFINKLY